MAFGGRFVKISVMGMEKSIKDQSKHHPKTKAQTCAMMPFFYVRACNAGHPVEDLQVFQSQ